SWGSPRNKRWLPITQQGNRPAARNQAIHARKSNEVGDSVANPCAQDERLLTAFFSPPACAKRNVSFHYTRAGREMYNSVQVVRGARRLAHRVSHHRDGGLFR